MSLTSRVARRLTEPPSTTTGGAHTSRGGFFGGRQDPHVIARHDPHFASCPGFRGASCPAYPDGEYGAIRCHCSFASSSPRHPRPAPRNRADEIAETPISIGANVNASRGGRRESFRRRRTYGVRENVRRGDYFSIVCRPHTRRIRVTYVWNATCNPRDCRDGESPIARMRRRIVLAVCVIGRGS